MDASDCSWRVGERDEFSRLADVFKGNASISTLPMAWNGLFNSKQQDGLTLA
jgi:hypothetical protein